MTLRDANDLVLPAVRATIAALPHDRDGEYAAIIRLAEQYAAAIDDAYDPKVHAWALRNLGPLLHDALEALGATPAARGKTVKEGPATGGTNRLAALRAAHRAS